MDGWLLAACAKLDVTIEQVLSARLDGDEAVLVVDYGIKGCPKIRLPLADLTPPEPPAIQVETDASPPAIQAEMEIAAPRKKRAARNDRRMI